MPRRTDIKKVMVIGSGPIVIGTLELALLGGVTLLDFAAAGLQGRLGVLLGGTGGASDAVTAGAAAQQEDDVAGRRALTADILRLHGPYHRADLHALGGIALVVDLTYVCRRKAYLVTITRIPSGGLAADHPLRKLAGNSVGHPGGDVAGSSDAHCLVDIGTSGKRVADGSAETGGGTSERFDLGRVVMGFVLELEEPFLLNAVDINVDENAAGVVLLALLQVVELAVRPQPTCTDRRS